ncbi:MAG TPA: tRNA lysidine(34) synthetase TilS [Solirubrobacteraceae bacterium]
MVEHARLHEQLLRERERAAGIAREQRARRQRGGWVQVDRGLAQAAIIAVCDALAMDEPVLESVRASGVLAAGERYVVLVSGGRDSVCLLDVVATIATPGKVTALHVDYGLRGEESDGDRRHVCGLCERLEVSLEVVTAPPPPSSGNLQAWARDLRYARAALLAGAEGIVATGHTASDQVETVLYRLAASPGRRALLGMSAREGRLVRPLLHLTREQTAAHCRARGLGWREDSSNGDSERFARARVRHEVLPALRAVHPAAEQNLLRSVELLRAEAEVLSEVVAVALAGRDRIALTRLAELPPALARLVVIRLAEDAAGSPTGAVGERLGELLALAPSGGSASLDVGGGVRAVVEYGVLRFERAANSAAPRATSLSVPGSAEFGRWRLHATLAAVESWSPAQDCESASIDADALGGEALTIRAWRAGDRMRPLGLDGSKSLADLFSDRRVPRGRRGTLPLVLCGAQIAWVPGVAVAEEFRVGAATRRLAVLQAEHL